MPFGKPSSVIVCTLEGGLKSICFAESNSSVPIFSVFESLIRGFKLVSAAMTREETPIVVSVTPKRAVADLLKKKDVRRGSIETNEISD